MIVYCGNCGNRIIRENSAAGRVALCPSCENRVPLPTSNLDKPQIRMLCKGCGGRLRAWVNQAGTTMRCPKCGTRFTLPVIAGKGARPAVPRAGAAAPPKAKPVRPAAPPPPVPADTARTEEEEPLDVGPLPARTVPAEPEDELLDITPGEQPVVPTPPASQEPVKIPGVEQLPTDVIDKMADELLGIASPKKEEPAREKEPVRETDHEEERPALDEAAKLFDPNATMQLIEEAAILRGEKKEVPDSAIVAMRLGLVAREEWYLFPDGEGIRFSSAAGDVFTLPREKAAAAITFVEDCRGDEPNVIVNYEGEEHPFRLTDDDLATLKSWIPG